MEANERKINSHHKDRFFRTLFNDKKALLSLYNAVNNTEYDDPEEIEINTIDNFIYMGMKNDLSFLVGCILNLYEQQSTENPNMALRGFLYFAKLYQKMFGNHTDLYSSKLISLPTPQFVVFFNGENEVEDKREVRLSDGFSEKGEFNPALECVATLININFGHNKELMDKCKELQGYSILIHKIRTKISNGESKEEAAEEAIDECIEEGILRDMLESHRGEATNMILEEYDEELHIKNEKNISYNEALDEGIRIFIKDKVEDNIPEMTIISKLQKGYKLSYEKAMEYYNRFKEA